MERKVVEEKEIGRGGREKERGGERERWRVKVQGRRKRKSGHGGRAFCPNGHPNQLT